jgi:hypothetical protein
MDVAGLKLLRLGCAVAIIVEMRGILEGKGAP